MKTRKQYSKPQVKKYGDIRKLTAASASGMVYAEQSRHPGNPNPPTTRTGM